MWTDTAELTSTPAPSATAGARLTVENLRQEFECLIDRWIATQQTHHSRNVKRIYYLSLEFLIGRLLGNNVINLKLEE